MKRLYTAPMISLEGIEAADFICGSKDNIKISKGESPSDPSEHEQEDIYSVVIPWQEIKDDDDVVAD